MIKKVQTHHDFCLVSGTGGASQVANCGRFARAATAVPCWRIRLSCPQRGEPAAFQTVAKIDTVSCCNATKKNPMRKSSTPYFSVLQEDDTVIPISKILGCVPEASHAYLVMFEACDRWLLNLCTRN